jgi:1-phosphofructokinase
MKIATVTLNPAIDQTVSVNNFHPGRVNRGQSLSFAASGKGVNVASYLADYGYETVVTGYLGRANATIFEQFFASRGIEDRFIRIPGDTRINVKIVDELNQQTTDINMPGEAPSQEAIEALFVTIEQLSDGCEWFVLSGSLPPGVPTVSYATIITQLKRRKKRIILDTSGKALQAGIQAGPTIVKPNLEELQQLVGRSLTGETEVQQAARQLLNGDVELVVVSMGKRGALLVDRIQMVQAVPPAMAVKKTFGAGDAMVAGLVVAQIQALNLVDCARLATAFSMGAIGQLSYNLSDAQTIKEYFQQVHIKMY